MVAGVTVVAVAVTPAVSVEVVSLAAMPAVSADIRVSGIPVLAIPVSACTHIPDRVLV
jgi:hypothetical protein